MSTKWLTSIDLARNALLNAVIQNLASAPSSPVAGLVYYDTTLNALGYYTGSAWVYATGGSGTVTSASVVTANGLAGSVATATTTPAITLSTTVTGLLKGNGTAISAAVSNTDYAPPVSPTFTGTVTVPTPSTSGAAATKGYVDGVAQGLSGKYSAVASTTGSETYTIAAGSVTVISGTTLDGQSPSVNDYVLVKDAPAASGTGSAGSTQPGNGLYQVTSATTNLSLSRAAVMSGTTPPAGAYVFIEGGTAAKSSGWVVSTPSTSAAFTYGSGNIAFTQFSGAGEITAGTGLSKSGNTLSLSTPVSVANGGSGAATLTGLVKGNGTSAFTAAAAGTDYAAATSGSSILKGNGAGGFTAAKYAAAIGDGASTSITVTHSLGTQDVHVQVYDATTFVQYQCDVTATSTSVVTLGFATAPSLNSLRVVVVG